MARKAAVYLVFQSLLAFLWWGAMLFRPDLRPLFHPSAVPDAYLFAFLLPDSVLYFGAALAAAAGFWQDRSWARVALWLHLGGAWFATLYCLALALLAHEAPLGAAAMGVSAVAATWIAVRWVR